MRVFLAGQSGRDRGILRFSAQAVIAQPAAGISIAAHLAAGAEGPIATGIHRGRGAGRNSSGLSSRAGII